MLGNRKNYKSIIWLIPMSLVCLLKIFTERDEVNRWLFIAGFILYIIAIIVILYEGYKNKNDYKIKS